MAPGVIRFMAIFVLITSAGIALEYHLTRIDGARGYRTFVAEAGNGLSTCLGVESRTHGAEILVGTRVLQVTPECSGIEAIGIFCAGVIAFPSGRKNTIIGLLLGLIGVGILNILRVSGLAVVAGWWPDRFDPAHDALTHLFPLFVVLPLWLCWFWWVLRREDDRSRLEGDGSGKQSRTGTARFRLPRPVTARADRRG